MYALDMSVQVFKELDYLISKNVVNTVVGSITHRSNLRYGTRKANLYCDEPLKLVAHINLKAEYDFDNIFIKGVRNYLQRESLSFRAQTLLSKGSQTSGNIFQTDDPNIRKIEKIILTEIEKYRLTYSESKDGLIRNWPDKYSLSGWIISMNKNGEIKPHIHGYGWLSGSIYINVPSKSDDDAGNFVVTLGEGYQNFSDGDPISSVVDVEAGSLVIFPASLMHYSIPFSSEEKRILLAFDFVPVF